MGWAFCSALYFAIQNEVREPMNRFRFRSGKIVLQSSAVSPNSASPVGPTAAAADTLMTMEHSRPYLFEGLLQKGAG